MVKPAGRRPSKTTKVGVSEVGLYAIWYEYGTPTTAFGIVCGSGDAAVAPIARTSIDSSPVSLNPDALVARNRKPVSVVPDEVPHTPMIRPSDRRVTLDGSEPATSVQVTEVADVACRNCAYSPPVNAG